VCVFVCVCVCVCVFVCVCVCVCVSVYVCLSVREFGRHMSIPSLSAVCVERATGPAHADEIVGAEPLQKLPCGLTGHFHHTVIVQGH
jgi:hypothetical protein